MTQSSMYRAGGRNVVVGVAGKKKATPPFNLTDCHDGMCSIGVTLAGPAVVRVYGLLESPMGDAFEAQCVSLPAGDHLLSALYPGVQFLQVAIEGEGEHVVQFLSLRTGAY